MKLKIQNPAAFLLRKGYRLATGPFPERKIPCGLNTFSRVFKSCNIVRAGLLTLIIARNQRISSQWRDRAGFSPASLFSPLSRGTPERI